MSEENSDSAVTGGTETQSEFVVTMNDDINSVDIELPESIDCDNIAALHSVLKELPITELKAVTLDAENLEDIDFASLQLFCGFKDHCKKNDVDLAWDNMPIELFQASESLDLSRGIGL